jgi:hypothetical protein
MLWKTRPGSADSRTVTSEEFRVEFKVQFRVRFNGLNLSESNNVVLRFCVIYSQT